MAARLLTAKRKEPVFACYISVRLNSRRLPKKALLKIRGRPIIEHIIDRAKKIRGIKHIIISTTEEPEDNILNNIALKNRVQIYHGPSKDRLLQWLGAAEKFEIDYFIEFDADDLFCDPSLMELSIAQMKKKPCGILIFPDTSVPGGAAICMSVEALRTLCQAKDTDNTVVPWKYIVDTGLISARELKITDKVFHNQSIRLTLDYPEDFQFFKKVFEEMDIKKNTIPLRKILLFLAKRPDLININFARQHDYETNFKKIPKLKLKRGFKPKIEYS